MDIPLPRLREDAVIRRFDGASANGRHIVGIGARHFLASELLAALLEMTRSASSAAALANSMSARFGRSFTPEEIGAILTDQVPRVLLQADAEMAPRGPLQFRVRLVGAAVLAPLLRFGAQLFAPPAAVMLGALLVAVHASTAYALWHHGLDSSGQASPGGVLALVLVGVAIHELGHLSACHRYGAPHGGIGVGVYWCLPVLYAEVHGAWLLPRARRSVVDVAGIYFQGLYLLALTALYLLEPAGTRAAATLQLALWVSFFLVLNTLNPVLKYDGYWLLSDLSGSHNLHRRMRENSRRCWAALRRWPGARWPTLSERLLLAGFVGLAAVYFGYVIHFLGHNLAYATARLEEAQSVAQMIGASAALLVSAALALGVTLMLARALGAAVARADPVGDADAHHVC